MCTLSRGSSVAGVVGELPGAREHRGVREGDLMRSDHWWSRLL